MTIKRPLVAVTGASVAGIVIAIAAGLVAHEGFSETPYFDSVGVATIGAGTTVYPDGTKVQITDKPITRPQAEEFMAAHLTKDASKFLKTVEGLRMWPHEVYAGLEFTYQFGFGNWSPNSSMLKNFKAGNYEAACSSFLLYRRAGGMDCSDPIKGRWGKANGCKGVWLRQLCRRDLCLGKVSIEQFQRNECGS